MNTCKAALRILKARKLYVIIYLVLIGTMMFSISWQIMRGSTAARATTYEPESARIAVIDRDDDAEHVAQSLRSYLALDGEMVTIDDDSISLQQAVASNYVDLIAIVPQGFAERYLQYADNATATQPTIDTVVSYASGAGSLAQLKVNEFLSLTRTAYLGMPQAQRTLDAAMATTLDAATADMKQSHIAVVSSDSEDDGTHRAHRHSRARSKPACIHCCWSCRYARSSWSAHSTTTKSAAGSTRPPRVWCRWKRSKC